MAIRSKDLKILWGRSAGLCAFPGCRASCIQESTPFDGTSVVGEVAHIVGKRPSAKSPRSNIALQSRELDSYSNLILLCPTHHRLVDQQPNTYSTALLHSWKDTLEYEVERVLESSGEHHDIAFYSARADISTVNAPPIEPAHILEATQHDSELHSALNRHRIVYLSGPPGGGKSTLALQYARKYQDELATTLWIDASTAASIQQSFLTIARRLDTPHARLQDTNLPTQSLISILQCSTKWLAIFDNCQDLMLMDRYWHLAQTGHLLVTTRSIPAERLRTFHVMGLALDKATSLLARLTHRTAQTPDDAARTESDVSTIVDLLNRNPQAIRYAAAFINNSRCSLSEFRTLYTHSPHQFWLLTNDPAHTDHPSHAIATLLLSLPDVTAAPARLLLGSMAVLQSRTIDLAIARSLFNCSASQYSPSSAITFRAAIAALRNHSLVELDPDADQIRVSSILLEAAYSAFDHSERLEYITNALTTFSAIFRDCGDELEILLRSPHLLMGLAEQLQSEDISTPETFDLLEEIAINLHSQGDLSHAAQLYEQITTQAIDQDPDSSRSVVRSSIGLALIHALSGDHNKALSCAQSGLTLAGRLPGNTIEHNQQSTRDLARVYFMCGEISIARTLLEKLLRQHQSQPTSNPHDIAQLLNDIGKTHGRDGDPGKALEYYKLAHNEWDHSPDHIGVISTINNIGHAHLQLGQFSRSLKYLTDAKRRWRRALGNLHPDTADTYNTLGLLYYQQGRLRRAEVYYTRALRGYTTSFGPDHPKAALTAGNLSLVSLACGDINGALLKAHHAHQIFSALPSPHPDDLCRSTINLSLILREIGQQDAGTTLLRNALNSAPQGAWKNAHLAQLHHHLSLFAPDPSSAAALRHARSSVRHRGKAYTRDSVEVAIGLIGFAHVRLARGEHDHATRILAHLHKTHCSTSALPSFVSEELRRLQQVLAAIPRQ